MKIKSAIIYWLLPICCLFEACTTPTEPREISFYHWKSKAEFTPLIAEAITETKAKTVYLHYFDVDQVQNSHEGDDGVYPIYPLKSVAADLKLLEIIPVVFISNKAIQQANVESLAPKIEKLIHQISLHHFKQKKNTIQLDCDWTQTTRQQYFRLIELLKHKFDVSVTIRLHQIKFQEKTGVPPVQKGTLMLYNVGDLADLETNSILDQNIVSKYINEKTQYPFRLDVALPLFSQMVVFNRNGNIRIIKGEDRQLFASKTTCFQSIADHVFELKRDTLYKGFQLSKGNKIKIEKLTEEEVLSSYQILNTSEISIGEVILYHLDDEVLQGVDLKKLREGL